jgi:hypothetical protein
MIGWTREPPVTLSPGSRRHAGIDRQADAGLRFQAREAVTDGLDDAPLDDAEVGERECLRGGRGLASPPARPADDRADHRRGQRNQGVRLPLKHDAPFPAGAFA